MSIDLPTSQVRSYLSAFGAAAVYVARGITGQVTLIAAASNLAAAVRQLGETIEIKSQSDVVWVQSLALARKLARMAARRAKFTGADPVAAVAEAANIHGIAITPHAVAIARAQRGWDRVAYSLDVMRSTGGLSVFNHRYASLRKGRLARGERTPSFAKLYAALRKALIVQIATGEKLDIAAASGQVLKVMLHGEYYESYARVMLEIGDRPRLDALKTRIGATRRAAKTRSRMARERKLSSH